MESLNISCKACNRYWKLILPKVQANIIVFAAICDCGEVFAGNLNPVIKGPHSIYSNGSFNIVDSIEEFPILKSE